MADTVQFRRDIASEWVKYNPVLLAGEIGIETDTHRFKLGDGLTAWTDLIYSSNRLQDDYFAYIDKEDIVAIEYSETGSISSTTLANGCKILYTYQDELLRRMDYTNIDGATVVAYKTFNYDALDQLTSVTKTKIEGV